MNGAIHYWVQVNGVDDENNHGNHGRIIDAQTAKKEILNLVFRFYKENIGHQNYFQKISMFLSFI